jgi:hypothetical protein
MIGARFTQGFYCECEPIVSLYKELSRPLKLF